MELYRINIKEDLTVDLITSLIERFQVYEMPRLQRLQDYYKGDSVIFQREMNDTSKPNNHTATPFAPFIVDTVQGYFLGKPITYSSNDEDFMIKLQTILDTNFETAHNIKVGKNASITGVAYELLYLNEEGQVKVGFLDPKEVFMVYDNSINTKPLAAIRFYYKTDYVLGEDFMHVEVYTDDTISFYREGKNGLDLVDVETHYFGGVPVIYYWNNDELQGDFEKIISLIDAYDKAVSDTSNNLEYFADSYLVIDDADLEPEDIINMKENRVIQTNNGAKPYWLVKSSDTIEVEEYKDRLKSDIFTMSHIPNPDNSSSSQSGESRKYDLFGLENSVSNKERLHKKSLEVRTKFITNILNIKGNNYDFTDINIGYTRNMPTNIAHITDMVSKLHGIVSHKTLLQQLPFVSDVAQELELIEAQDSLDMFPNFVKEEE